MMKIGTALPVQQPTAQTPTQTFVDDSGITLLANPAADAQGTAIHMAQCQ